MILICTSVVISFPLVGLPEVTLPFQFLSEYALEQRTAYAYSKLNAIPNGLSQDLAAVIEPEASLEEEVRQTPCLREPIGLGIPGFQPGIDKKAVLGMFGAPSKISNGYWPNTNAVIYYLIPGKVSLGFLFDRDSERLRQTEASFAGSVDSYVILGTLNSMLGCQLNEEIKQGFQKVWQRRSVRFSFSLGPLNGVIEREDRDRVYIGIWEADLH